MTLFQDHLGGIHVPVVVFPATLTYPPPIRQLQVLVDPTATRTRLARRKPPIQPHHGPPVPLRLVLQLASDLKERGVGYRTSETVVLHHVPNRQTLQNHHLVLVDDLPGRLVDVVRSDVPDPQVHLGEPLLGSLPVLAPLLFLAQSPLHHL